MSKMNIVFTGSFSYPIGMAGTKRIQNLIDVLNEKGCNTSVLLINNSTINTHSGVYNKTLYNTILPINLSKYFIFLIPILYLKGFWYLIRNKENNKSLNYLYIYSGINLENILYVMFAKLIGYKIIVDIVEDFSLNEENVSKWRALKIKSINYFEKKIQKYADYLIVISSFLMKKFEKKVDNKVPIHLMPVTSWQNQMSLDETLNYNYVLYSGSYGEKDGVKVLINAFIKLVNEFPKMKLILTGKPKKEILDLLMPYKKNVVLTGFLTDDDYYKTLRTSYILTMTRIDSGYAHAGFPFKLGEYLATGNPIIATDVSDISKFLTNNLDAQIIKPNDIEGLYQSLKFLINNNDKGEQIGKNGLLTHGKYFTPDVVGKKFIDFLNTT